MRLVRIYVYTTHCRRGAARRGVGGTRVYIACVMRVNAADRLERARDKDASEERSSSGKHRGQPATWNSKRGTVEDEGEGEEASFIHRRHSPCHATPRHAGPSRRPRFTTRYLCCRICRFADTHPPIHRPLESVLCQALHRNPFSCQLNEV